MEKRNEETLDIGKLGPQERLDEEERKKMKDRRRSSIRHTKEDERLYPPLDEWVSHPRHPHTEKQKRHTKEHKGPRLTIKLPCMEEPMLGDDKEEQKSKEAFHGGSLDPPIPLTKGKEVDIEHKDDSSSPESNWMSDDFDLGHTETLEQKLKEAYYCGSDWVLGSPIPQYVDTEHEYEGLYVKSNWSLEEVEEEDEELMDADDLDAEVQEQERELNAFYGGSDSVSLGQLVIRDQLHAPPSPHGMSTPKILYLCFGEYMAGNQVLYSIQALRLHSFPPVQILKAKELAYIRGEGLPLHMGCGLFGSNIVFLGGVESRFDCRGGDFTTYPRKDIYAFDTKHPYTCQVFNNSSLQQGKSRPLLVQYYDKLYVLSILVLRFSDGRHFSPAFEMFDLKQGKWATLPAPEPFHWHKSSRFLFRVVVGSCIFVRASLGPVLCFNMADPSPKWREHNFTNCSELPWECMGQTLTIEYGDGDGDWVILSCRPHLDIVDGYNDPPHYRHYEWKSTFITGHLMSKDYTLLTSFEPDLKIPHGYLPPGDKPLSVRGVEYKLVHLQGREICLIISVDRGDEFEDREMERMQTYVMIFEFEIVEGTHTLAFKILHPASMIINDRSSESRTNKVGLEGAFFL